MGTELGTNVPALAGNDVCDVFLSHAGGQTRGLVDCVHRILVRSGGRGTGRNKCVEVFLDEHSLQSGVTPWELSELKALTCCIGAPFSTVTA
jgi:hypothetical protein